MHPFISVHFGQSAWQCSWRAAAREADPVFVRLFTFASKQLGVWLRPEQVPQRSSAGRRRGAQPPAWWLGTALGRTLGRLGNDGRLVNKWTRSCLAALWAARSDGKSVMEFEGKWDPACGRPRCTSSSTTTSSPPASMRPGSLTAPLVLLSESWGVKGLPPAWNGEGITW